MQQVLAIHGGNTFENYGEFLESLKTKEIALDNFLPQRGWKDALGLALGIEFEVFAPLMPNPSNAQYEEWKIWFGRILGLMNDGVILIGHSLGGVFLPKYLSENESPKKIKAVILVAAPFDNEGGTEKLASFALKKPLDGFARQAGEIHLFHSKDDPCVPFAQLAKYQKSLPTAQAHIFENRGHFRQENFSEMVDLVRYLYLS
jgi:predicted alpha/beta hydrolase family esterase